MKKILLFFLILIVLFSCGGKRNLQNLTTDEGVIINGVKWATRNVDTPGTFVRSPEDVGMFYQWNRIRAWRAVGSHDGVIGWDGSTALGTVWVRTNDPCPEGWRIPTEFEFQRLIAFGSVWTTKNGVTGRLFGTAPNQIFLPAAGWRSESNGALILTGTGGDYWSSTQSRPGNAHYLYFDRRHARVYENSRARGLNIRCVADI